MRAMLAIPPDLAIALAPWALMFVLWIFTE
jgi:hypothetical protein